MLSLPELAAMVENISYFRNAIKSFITKIQFFIIPRSLQAVSNIKPLKQETKPRHVRLPFQPPPSFSSLKQFFFSLFCLKSIPVGNIYVHTIYEIYPFLFCKWISSPSFAQEIINRGSSFCLKRSLLKRQNSVFLKQNKLSKNRLFYM